MSKLAFELKLKAPACSVSIGAADFCSLTAARPRNDRIPESQKLNRASSLKPTVSKICLVFEVVQIGQTVVCRDLRMLY